MPKFDLTDPYKKGKDAQSVPQPDYNDDEIDYRGFMIMRMESARNQRSTTHVELNDMDYVTSYDTNARVANAYLRPKENEEDVRVVSGITKEKIVTFLSALLNYDFGPNIEAFDDNDDLLGGIGEKMEDLIQKSREVEDYDNKRRLIYKELLDQGTCFVEEVWSEPQLVSKDFNKMDWLEGVSPSKINWKKRLTQLQGECQANLLNGKKVYLGNFHEFYMENQPFVVTRDMMAYAQAEAIFGKWERWKNVPRKFVRTAPLDEDDINSWGDKNWSLEEPEMNMVEILKYQDKWSNEYQVMLNGVMMLPVGFPLTAVSPSGEYNIIKGDIDPISDDFAISTSIPNKTKVLEAVFDDFLRVAILKNQQSFKPPMINNTGRVLSKRMLFPGKITADIEPGEFFPAIQPTGVTPPEFNMMNFMRGVIDNMSISPVSQGMSPDGNQTATEIKSLQYEGMKKQGLAMLGVRELEKKLVWKRLYNILNNWIKPIDTVVDEIRDEIKNVYRTVVVDSTIGGVVKGKKVYEFTDDESKLSRDQVQMDAEGDMLTEAYKVPTVKTYLNVEAFQQMKFNWKIDITPTEKSSDALDRVMFVQNVTQGFQLFGPQAFNLDYVKHQWALKNELDPEKLFQAPEQMEQQQMGQGQQPGAPPTGQTQVGKQMMEGTRSQTRQPSINTLAAAI